MLPPAFPRRAAPANLCTPAAGIGGQRKALMRTAAVACMASSRRAPFSLRTCCPAWLRAPGRVGPSAATAAGRENV